jgi:hypothetical protein
MRRVATLLLPLMLLWPLLEPAGPLQEAPSAKLLAACTAAKLGADPSLCTEVASKLTVFCFEWNLPEEVELV